MQLDLFEKRLPRKPYCTDDLQSGLKIRSARHAVRRKYIQVNPPWLRSWLVFDVDREGAALAWEDALLPEPAWCSINPANGHAHIAFGLDAPVLIGEHTHDRPVRYLAAVESAMRAKLDADPSYSGLITKNPLHKDWRTLWSQNAGVYDLAFLSDHLDLPRFVPKRKPAEIGLGRNVTLFDWLRHYAYRAIRGWKRPEPGIYIRWMNHLYEMALQRNGDFANPLDFRECYHIAKSVAKWVWNRFDIDASDKRFAQRQRQRGRIGGLRSGAVRQKASEDKQASARLMRAKGMTQTEIAQALGVTDRTVRNWLNG
jgi:hypothetical protein